MAVKIEEIDLDRIAAKERRAGPGSSLKFVFAIFIGAVWIVPFYYLVISIFKTTEQYSLNHPLSLPTGVAPFLDNVIDAWVTAKMGAGLLNSTLYGLVGAGLAIFFAAMAAYGLSRIDFKRKNFWFMLIFAGTVFPFQMYLIPLFFGYQKAGIINSHFGMVLVYTAICIPFPTLVLKNYMSGLSREMDEAARMDGARGVHGLLAHRAAKLQGAAHRDLPPAIHLGLERPPVLHGSCEPHGDPLDHERAPGLPGELFVDRPERGADGDGDRDRSFGRAVLPAAAAFHGGNAHLVALSHSQAPATLTSRTLRA